MKKRSLARWLVSLSVCLLVSGCTGNDLAVSSSDASPAEATTSVTTATSEVVAATAPPTTLSDFERQRIENAKKRKRETALAESAFLSYQKALEDLDADAATGLVTDVTFDWYHDSMVLAQSGTREELDMAPVHQFVTALRLRALLGSEIHDLASGEETFALLVAAGLPPRPPNFDDFRVAVSGPAPFRGSVRDGAQRTWWTLQRNDDVWLVNAQYTYNFLSFLGDDMFALEVLTGRPLTRVEYIEYVSSVAGIDVAEIP